MPESDLQQPQETMGTSTDSSQNWRKNLDNKWTRAFKFLPQALGVESIRRTMKTEDDLSRRDALAYHELLDGDRGSSVNDESDDMGDIILGDVKTEYHYPPQKKGIGALAKGVIAAGLVGTGIGAGVGIPMLVDALTRENPQIVQPGEEHGWKLGQPIIE